MNNFYFFHKLFRQALSRNRIEINKKKLASIIVICFGDVEDQEFHDWELLVGFFMIYHGNNCHGGYCSLFCKKLFDKNIPNIEVDIETFDALYEFDINNRADTTIITKNLLLCCAYDMIKVKT